MLRTLAARSFTSVAKPPNHQFGLYAIDSNSVGFRFDKYVMSALDMPWSAAHKHIEGRSIFVFRPSMQIYVMKEVGYKLTEGDMLCVTDRLMQSQKNFDEQKAEAKAQTKAPKPAAVKSALNPELIVFENDHVIVIDKPNGMPCQQGTGLAKTPSLDELATAYLAKKDESKQAYLVHRLDQFTSGLVVVAKSREMA